MGYLRPTAIIVSGSYGETSVEDAHAKAVEIFEGRDMPLVSGIVAGVVNNERSFFIAWDGSKEGWNESDTGDECRAEFVAWLRDRAYDDGSHPLDWVELQYGGDDREVRALAHDGERVIA